MSTFGTASARQSTDLCNAHCFAHLLYWAHLTLAAVFLNLSGPFSARHCHNIFYSSVFWGPPPFLCSSRLCNIPYSSLLFLTLFFCTLLFANWFYCFFIWVQFSPLFSTSLCASHLFSSLITFLCAKLAHFLSALHTAVLYCSSLLHCFLVTRSLLSALHCFTSLRSSALFFSTVSFWVVLFVVLLNYPIHPCLFGWQCAAQRCGVWRCRKNPSSQKRAWSATVWSS